jgi:hypothetical protein
MGAPEQITWAELLVMERRMRALWPELTADELRQYWQVVEQVWMAYAKQTHEGIIPDPPPIDLAAVMGNLAGYIAVGKIPEPILHAATPGGRKFGPTERAHIGAAVAYHKAAKDGLKTADGTIRVADRSPTKTISLQYGVDASTVRGWCRLVTFSPEQLGKLTSDELTASMRVYGLQYRAAGRSSAAILERGAGRK